MKFYYTQTQEDYNALMKELEEQGVLWHTGDKPTNRNHWLVEKENTTVRLEDKTITYGGLNFFIDAYPDIFVQVYKARKGWNDNE